MQRFFPSKEKKSAKLVVITMGKEKKSFKSHFLDKFFFQKNYNSTSSQYWNYPFVCFLQALV